MNIKKVDDKPMVIHTKEKTKLHVKTAPETKIKAGNVLTVERTPKFAGAEREAKADNMDKRMSALKVKFATKDSNGKADAEKRLSDKRGQSAQSSSVKSKSVKEDIKKSMQKENSKYAQFEKSKQDREKAIGRKNGSTVSTLASVGAKTSLDQMEGGSEVYESYMVARNLSTTVKEVNVKLKTYHDMISEYGFDEEEQEMLAELMKPENLAMMGYIGGGGDPGETLSPEQYQAIVDAVSDANGKKVVEYALSKVGYPYSQDLRDSGTHFDCSSLAYYAWQNAGVNIMYEGANTAAAEGKFCYDHNYLVNYEEMQPGDLIFYSYSKNGRFFNITHVAIYVGNGMVVEAANERIGVVYRPVQSRSSIVFIGRPR